MKKLIVILSILAGIALVVFGLYKIFLSSKVPSGFLEKYNEIHTLSQEMVAASTLSDTFVEDLTKKEASKDYAGALQLVNDAMAKKNEATAKLESLITKTEELKKIIEKISDPQVKASAQKVAGLIEKQNSSNREYLTLQKQLVEIMIKYYQDLKAGKVATVPKNISELTKKVNDAGKKSEDITKEFEKATEELGKLANLTFSGGK